MWYEFYIRQFIGVVSKHIGMHGKNKSLNNLFVSTKTFMTDTFMTVIIITLLYNECLAYLRVSLVEQNVEVGKKLIKSCFKKVTDID